SLPTIATPRSGAGTAPGKLVSDTSFFPSRGGAGTLVSDTLFRSDEVLGVMDREAFLAEQARQRVAQLAGRADGPFLSERDQRLRRARLVLQAHLAFAACERLQRALQRRHEVRPRLAAAPPDRDSPRMLLDLVVDRAHALRRQPPRG